MSKTNQTMVTYFIIKGISDVPEMQVPIFLLVLVLYLMTLSGNMTILLLVCLDHHLHTPMYFFLCNLSILDMSSTTVTLHKVIIMFLSGNNTVSFPACLAQMCIFSWVSGNTLIMLTAMSYDRYVAICNPLRYPIVMNKVVCVLLATVCWALSLLQVLPAIVILSRFSCYKHNEINHFFCDIVILMQLSCSDTSILKLLIFTEGVILSTFTPFLLTFISYIFIIVTIMRISSNIGRRKAFYTCSSHLTVVVLLYLTLVFQYLMPISANTLDSNKVLSLFNTALVPMLNPMIYSLKNKDVNSAVSRMLKVKRTSTFLSCLTLCQTGGSGVFL